MKIIYRMHAVRRMFERNINEEEVLYAIKNGTAIQEYPNDQPYPSRLLLSIMNGRPIHTVIAENQKDDEIIVITVYEPDAEQWDKNYERKIK